MYALIGCLVSTLDKLTTFRLAALAALVSMQRHLYAGHFTLLLVVLILFYHGKASPWPWGPQLATVIRRSGASEGALAATISRWRDLTVTSDNQIARHRRMAMLELLQE
ncbi:Rpn family recombination-promoting nuclease/putative transposase [Klebsiella pneumoniae]